MSTWLTFPFSAPYFLQDSGGRSTNAPNWNCIVITTLTAAGDTLTDPARPGQIYGSTLISVNSNTGLILSAAPTLENGNGTQFVRIFNSAARSTFPTGGFTIQDSGTLANSNFDLNGAKQLTFVGQDYHDFIWDNSTNWKWLPRAGFSQSVAIGLTAFATGGQANATVLYAGFNKVGTVVTAGDSVKLILAVGSGRCTRVYNGGANPMDCFPTAGDSINGLAANTAVSIAPGTMMSFYDADAALWVAQ